MFTAVDKTRGVVVTGGEETATDGGEPSDMPPYECLNCGETLEYTGQAGRCQQFTHHGSASDCFNAGNVSSSHRLCQEAVAARVVNQLPVPATACEVAFERQVTVGRSFVIPDVQMTAPGRLVVEVVNTNRHISGQRLRRLLAAGYGVMIVVVTTGPVAPAALEQRLESLAPITVGRFNPDTEQLSLGLIVTPAHVAAKNART